MSKSGFYLAAILIAGCVLVFGHRGAYAASFQCSGVLTTVEQAICRDNVLSQLDDALTSAYQQLRRALSDDSDDLLSLVESQRTWMKGRNNCGDIRQCLINYYNMRLRDLGEVAAQHNIALAITNKNIETAQQSGALTASQSSIWQNPDDPTSKGPTETSQSEFPSSKDHKERADGDIRLFPLIVSAFGILGVIGWLSRGIENKCPLCKKWHARKIITSIPIGTRTKYRNESRVREYRNSEGRLTGTSTSTQTVPYSVTTYRNENECKSCRYQWKSVE